MDHFLAGCEPLTICRTGSRALLALPRGWRCLCPASCAAAVLPQPAQGPGAAGELRTLTAASWRSWTRLAEPRGAVQTNATCQPHGNRSPLEPAGMLLGAQLLPSCDRPGAASSGVCAGGSHTAAWPGLGVRESGKSSSLYHRDLWFFFSFFILIYLMLPHSMVVSP